MWSLMVLLLVVTGCGGESVPVEYSGPPTVSGKVSLDGTPLSGVTVSFEKTESKPLQAVTSDSGRYEFMGKESTPPLGKYLVRITRLSGSETSDSEPQTLPARYNSNSDLVVDVLPGQNAIDFSLTTASEEDGTEE
tara:strand:+ start:99920 stop:100327 length:408 start_codon:yes stop_codon:yes gene_type:complete